MQIQKTNSLPQIDCGKSSNSDRALIALIANGDEAALEELFRRYNARVYRLALRLTGNRSIAEETVSDVFVAVWRQAKSFQARSQVSTWLFTIARHKTLSAVQRRRDLQLDENFALSIKDEADTPEEAFANEQRRSMLRKCLRELPSAHRQVLDLFYFHGRTISEVVKIVGIPASTVKTRMFYARSRMAELLWAAGMDGDRAPIR